jgi:anti-sigma factor RsiW
VRKNRSPIGLEDLSGYLDGELDAGRRAAVERDLADNPEAAARVVAYRRRDQTLRLALMELAPGHRDERLPTIRPAHPAGGRWRWLIAATVFLCVMLGAATWWQYASQADSQALSRLAQVAVTAHLHSVAHPDAEGDVASDRDPVSAPSSWRFGFPLKAPDLSGFGYRLVGIRNVAGSGGPAAVFFYRDSDGREVSCYVERLGGNRETPFKREKVAGVNVVYRLDEELGYAVVGALSLATLQQIAEAGYRDVFDRDRP